MNTSTCRRDYWSGRQEVRRYIACYSSAGSPAALALTLPCPCSHPYPNPFPRPTLHFQTARPKATLRTLLSYTHSPGTCTYLQMSNEIRCYTTLSADLYIAYTTLPFHEATTLRYTSIAFKNKCFASALCRHLKFQQHVLSVLLEVNIIHGGSSTIILCQPSRAIV